MNKEIKQLETYESPNLNVLNIKVQQCIATSIGNGSITQMDEEDNILW